MNMLVCYLNEYLLSEYLASSEAKIESYFTTFSLDCFNRQRIIFTSYSFEFSGCFGYRNGSQNSLSWNNIILDQILRLHREVYLEHKQMPKRYLSRC